MDHYIYTGTISDNDISSIRKILRRNHIRRGYNPARVYRAKERKYVVDSNRLSLKTTFYHSGLKNIIKSYLPDGLVIPSDNHIDLTYYKTGHYFREHMDFVKELPDNAIQVTLIVGLLTTPVGGTSIRVQTKAVTYPQSIRKGGLLIFNSRLPHAGEKVLGEKEILVLTGYLFSNRLVSPKAPLQFSDYYRCIAVYNYNIGVDEDPCEPVDSSPHYLCPTFYIYDGNQLRFIAYRSFSNDGLTAHLVKREKVEKVSDFLEEELALIGDTSPYPISLFTEGENPILGEILTRKGLLDIFEHLERSNSRSQHKVVYSYESDDDFCNGWDEYGGGGGGSSYIESEYTCLTCSKTFSVTLSNKYYYRYWLERVGILPSSLYDSITQYLIM